MILPPATPNEQEAQSKPLKSTADTLAIAAQRPCGSATEVTGSSWLSDNDRREMDKTRTPQDCHNTTRPIAVLANDIPNGAMVRPHHHAPAQLIHALSGVMTVKSPEGSWVVPPRRALWIPPGVSHEVLMAGPVSTRSAYVTPEAVEHAGLSPRCQVISVSPLLHELLMEAVDLPAEYDLDGWKVPDLINPTDVNVIMKKPDRG